MPSKKTSKPSRKSAAKKPLRPKRHFAAKIHQSRHQAQKKSGHKPPIHVLHPSKKKSRPDIRVKKASYSKVARQAVLSSASARQQLIEMGGENTIDIIREFDQDMSDEDLARKTGIKASDVRVVLNRLHSCGLFSYTRVRDRDSGWYSYIWKMSEGKLRDFVSVNESEPLSQKEEFAGQDDYLKNNAALSSPFLPAKRRR